MRSALLALLLFSPCLLWAAGVSQVKNDKVLLELSGLDGVAVGDELFTIDDAGKRKALVKITQVRRDKAIATIVKGKPAVGQDVVLKNGSKPLSREVRDTDLPSGESAPAGDYYKRLTRRYTGNTWGVLGGLMQTNMTAKFTAGSGLLTREVSAKMKGTSFGALGYYDYPISPAFQIRGMGGLEQIGATGSVDQADCNSSTTCDFKVTYLSLYGVAKFNFFDNGGLRAWAGLHYGFLTAMSKSSSVLNTKNISTNQIYGISTGVEIPSGRSNYIPVTLDYGMFPKSDTVDANIITIRAGYGWLL